VGETASKRLRSRVEIVDVTNVTKGEKLVW
jgi:hypothetical protein